LNCRPYLPSPTKLRKEPETGKITRPNRGEKKLGNGGGPPKAPPGGGIKKLRGLNRKADWLKVLETLLSPEKKRPK